MTNLNDFLNKWLRGTGFAKFCLRIAFISTVLGALALTISLSVTEGFHQEILNNAFKYDSHLQINHIDKERLNDLNKVDSIVKSKFPDAKIFPVINQLALTRIDRKNDAYMIKGLPKEILANRYKIDTTRDELIYLSQSELKKYNSKDIVFIFNDKLSSNFKVNKKKITGSYRAGFASLDANTIITDLKTAREITKYSLSEFDRIEIELPEGLPSNKEIQELSYELGFPYMVNSFRDIHWIKIQWIEIQKDPIAIALALITLVAISNIITGLLVVVVDKFSSIGILRSLGTTKSQIRRLFFLRGLQFGFLGSLTGYGIGLILGLTQNYFQLINLNADIYFIDSVKVVFLVKHFIFIILFTSVISGIASILPAYLALKLEPIKAIRSI